MNLFEIVESSLTKAPQTISEITDLVILSEYDYHPSRRSLEVVVKSKVQRLIEMGKATWIPKGSTFKLV